MTFSEFIYALDKYLNAEYCHKVNKTILLMPEADKIRLFIVLIKNLTLGLAGIIYFYYIRNMEMINAIQTLAALAQETRLTIFRALVQAGEPGVSAGELARTLGIPNATLSFHLKELVHAELIIARQESRFIYYSAHFTHMNALIGYLTENCCAGTPCLPAAVCCDDNNN